MKFFAIFLALSLLVIPAFGTDKPILIIGDSLTCGPFGVQLVKNLTKAGHQVTMVCSVGSTALNWLSGKNQKGSKCQTMKSEDSAPRTCSNGGALPHLEELLAHHQHEHVVVALGTNSAGCSHPAGKRVSYCDHAVAPASYETMAKMVNEASDECEWIGPPHFQPGRSKHWAPGRVANMESTLDAFYGSLKSRVEGFCPLKDSRPFTASSTPGISTVDGVHRDSAAGTYWANKITPLIGRSGGGEDGDTTRSVFDTTETGQ